MTERKEKDLLVRHLKNGDCADADGHPAYMAVRARLAANAPASASVAEAVKVSNLESILCNTCAVRLLRRLMDVNRLQYSCRD